MHQAATHVHLDLLGGLAGDMFLAAALDAGLVQQEPLQATLRKVGLGPVRVVVEPGKRGALAGSHLSFCDWDPEAERSHRHLSTILQMLESSELPRPVARRAAQLFQVLGEAEAAVHGMSIEKVHFHECGAVDSLLDFVGAAWVIESSQASWSAGPVPAGEGTVRTDHGVVPVPVPATVRLLEGFEIEPRPVRAELVTPTGAAILRYLSREHVGLHRRPGRLRSSGFGLGSRDLEGLANAVRMTVLTPASEATHRDLQSQDVIGRLSCEVDDMSPELLPFVEQRLMVAGALDCTRETVAMKKGRQGVRFTVLHQLQDRDRLAEILFRETSTFGLRCERVERLKLQRRVQTVVTTFGDVRVKIGSLNGEDLKASPELEDCARLAESSGKPLRQIFGAAARAADALLGKSGSGA